MNEWISVKDRLPEEYERVLVYDGEEITCAELVISQFGNFFYIMDCLTTKQDVIAWQPLPEPPKGE